MTVDIAIAVDADATEAAESGRARFAARISRQALGLLGAVIILALAVTAIAADQVAPYSPTAQDAAPIEDPSWRHPFGTDRFGRDVLSRTIFGARVSLGVALTAVAIGTVIGVAGGLAAGYLGGLHDRLNQFMLDLGLAVPGIVALMVVVAAFGPSLKIVTIAIAATAVPAVMRVVRGCVLKEKESLYVEAARAVGATDSRVVIRHVLPNIAPSIIVMVSAMIPAAILSEATLSFLGFGARPPTASWGGDLSSDDARAFFELQPWMAIAPGAALSITVLSFNMLGDTLRDLLDPRLRGSR